MRIFKSYVLLLALVVFPFLLQAQSFEVPSDIVLKSAADYKKYEKDIVAAIDWLEQTPIDDKDQKRKEVNSFVVQWISGSPSVSIKMYGDILCFYEVNPDLLTNYMGGWARYVLQNPADTDAFRGNMAGLRSVISVYRTGKGVKKDPKTEKLVKLEKEGKLEDWAKQHFKD